VRQGRGSSGAGRPVADGVQEQALIDLEKRCSTQLTFVSDSNIHVEDFRIQNGQTGEVLYNENQE
jgi:hypothetical protein